MTPIHWNWSTQSGVMYSLLFAARFHHFLTKNYVVKSPLSTFCIPNKDTWQGVFSNPKKFLAAPIYPQHEWYQGEKSIFVVQINQTHNFLKIMLPPLKNVFPPCSTKVNFDDVATTDRGVTSGCDFELKVPATSSSYPFPLASSGGCEGVRGSQMPP